MPFGGNSFVSRGTTWSNIARVVDQAPWKKPEQLAAERQPEALHERSHGQVLPVFMVAAPLEGVVIWRDGPITTTTTHTEEDYTLELVPTTLRTPWGRTIDGVDVQRVYETTTTTVTRTLASFAVAHSFNQFQHSGEVLKVEFDDIVVFDVVEGIALPAGVTMRAYDGIDNGFDPTMLAKDGAALTPAYHGLRYLFFDEIDLAGFGGAIPASIRILWGNAPGPSATVVDLNAVLDAGLSNAEGLVRGETLSGFNPDQVLTLSLPAGQTYQAWDAHGDGAFWRTRFRVILDGDTGNYIETPDTGGATPEEARATFVPLDITGASSYTFFIFDTVSVSDNQGGLSIQVEAAAGGASTGTLAAQLETFSRYDDDRGGLLTDAQVTTEGLDGIVNGGVIIDSDTDLREFASRLAELWGVLKVETATGVKWVKKATDGAYAADVVLTESDLVEDRRGDAVIKIATRDRNPKEIPAEIEVRYISSAADYEPLLARAAWPQGVFDTALSLLKRSISVPVVLTDSQAAELTWGMLARERAANKTHSLTLRSNRLAVEISDVFELTAGGQAITGMFTKQTKLPDHSLEMTAEGYLSRAATVVAAETPIVHVRPPVSLTTQHVFLDGPLVSPAHDGAGGYLVGYSVLTGPEGWQGGSVWRRRPGATEWEKLAETAGHHPVVGVLSAPLPASPWPFETDTENTLTFSVAYGDADDIAAQTEAEFYEAAGVIAVGAPGRWTFLTWRNKTVNGDGTITLDTLRQGLKGTEVHEGTSEAGDHVVLVKASQAMEIPYDLADLGLDVEIKAPALGVHPNAVAASSYTVSGAAETPRAPGNLAAVIDGADIDLTWDRRSRLLVDETGEFEDGTEAPLGADLDVYQVEILDGPAGTVLRTYSDVAGEAKTYASADITADFGSMPGNLSFRVRQKTSITGIGHGHAAERSVAL